MISKLLALVLSAAALGVATQPAQADPVDPDGLLPTLITNGPVHTVLPDEDGLLIGGRFTRIGNPDGAAGIIDASTGALATAPLGITGLVADALPDGSGGFYVAGAFTTSAGPRNLVRVRADGTVDPAFRPDPDAGVARIIAGPGGSLFVAGQFGSIGGLQRPRLALVDGATGDASAAFAPSLQVTTIDGLLHQNGALYVGGDLSAANGAVVNLVRLNPTTGAAAAGFNPNPTGVVQVLAGDGTTIYAGGSFTSIDGSATSEGLARVNAQGTVMAGFDPSPSGNGQARSVWTLALYGGSLYAGGSFHDIGGEQGLRGLAKLDPATGAADDAFAPRPESPPASLRVSGGRLWAGGVTSLDGESTPGVVSLDPLTGERATSLNPGPDNNVLVAAPSGDRVLLGGAFSSLTSVDVGNLARLNADGTAIDPGFVPPRPSGPLSGVQALVRDGKTDDVYVAGRFTHIGGASQHHLARMHRRTGAIDSTFAPVLDGPAATVAVDHAAGDVYVGGAFATVGGSPLPHLARLSATSGAPDTAWSPAPDAQVSDLELLDDGALIAAGHFGSIGGTTNDAVARVRLSNGAAQPWPASGEPQVHGLRRLGDGSFLLAGSGGVRRLDPATGAVSSILLGGAVRDVVVREGVLFAAGPFAGIGGSALLYGLARASFDDLTLDVGFTPLGPGQQLDAIEVDPRGRVVTGGNAAAVVDGRMRAGLLIFDAPFAAPPADPTPSPSPPAGQPPASPTPSPVATPAATPAPTVTPKPPAPAVTCTPLAGRRKVRCTFAKKPAGRMTVTLSRSGRRLATVSRTTPVRTVTLSLPSGRKLAKGKRAYRVVLSVRKTKQSKPTVKAWTVTVGS